MDYHQKQEGRNLAILSSFSYWKAGEPTHLIGGEDCVLWHNNWIDVSCNDPYHWICEKNQEESPFLMLGMFDLYSKAL